MRREIFLMRERGGKFRRGTRGETGGAIGGATGAKNNRGKRKGEISERTATASELERKKEARKLGKEVENYGRNGRSE